MNAKGEQFNEELRFELGIHERVIAQREDG